MKLKFCVACGATNDLQHHHLITRAEGGTNDQRNLITLCTSCHWKLHKRLIYGVYNASERTKAGLAAAKERGVKLGNPRLAETARGPMIAAKKAEADRFARAVEPIIREAQGAGAKTLRAIADALEARGIRTPQGKKWSAMQVSNVLKRLAS
jgi:hypothetical protein